MPCSSVPNHNWLCESSNTLIIELAGTSVAMFNAQEKVKEKADIILPHTNDEDGVAKYLQGLV